MTSQTGTIYYYRESFEEKPDDARVNAVSAVGRACFAWHAFSGPVEIDTFYDRHRRRWNVDVNQFPPTNGMNN